MKQLNSKVKEGRIHLKAFPGAKANQLNHYVISTLEEFDYDCAKGIHVCIKDTIQSKDMSELKDLPKKSQFYNIGKVYVSYILPSTRASIDIRQINKVIKELCDKNNFVVIDHQIHSVMASG